MAAYSKHSYDYDDLRPLQFLHTDLDLECMGIGMGRMAPGKGYSFWHTHEHQEEVYICLDGSLTLLVDDDEIPMKRGDAVRVAPEAKRAVGNRTRKAGVVLIVGAMPYEGYETAEGRSHITDGNRLEEDAPDWSLPD